MPRWLAGTLALPFGGCPAFDLGGGVGDVCVIGCLDAWAACPFVYDVIECCRELLDEFGVHGCKVVRFGDVLLEVVELDNA